MYVVPPKISTIALAASGMFLLADLVAADTFQGRFRTVYNYSVSTGYVGGFPNFHETDVGQVKAYGAVLLTSVAAEWRDIPATDLGNANGAAARFRAVYDYAHSNGFVGGFPNFHSANYGEGTVFGAILIKSGAAEWRDIPAVELGNPSGAQTMFRAIHDYAVSNGYIGGFPNFHSADYGNGKVFGAILIKPSSGIRKDLRTCFWGEVKQIEGWFGSQNQGAGIATARINDNTRPDLIVFHIDNPPGANRGYYRIGWDLNPSGVPAGGWSERKSLPNESWFGAQSAGADIAVADVNGNGRPDLLVFHIDARERSRSDYDEKDFDQVEPNRGYYRIGWDLTRDGDVSGGWTDPWQLPGKFGVGNEREVGWLSGPHGDFDNGGGGITVINNRTLVVFALDRKIRQKYEEEFPPDLKYWQYHEPNKTGFYQMATLSPTGAATNWSRRYEIPGSFGRYVQATALHAADLTGDGNKELLVFYISNPKGGNRAYFRIAKNVTYAGDAEWRRPVRVPGWFGARNQGGGITVTQLRRPLIPPLARTYVLAQPPSIVSTPTSFWPDVIVMHIDNPPKENNGYYRIGFDLDADLVLADTEN